LKNEAEIKIKNKYSMENLVCNGNKRNELKYCYNLKKTLQIKAI